jgi:predicted nucleotidyltransferase
MKIHDILTEEQRFDFDKHRDTILRFVQNTLDGKPNNRQFNPFYELIVGGGQVGAATKLGIDPKMAAAWKQYFQSKPFLGGAGEPWSQVNIGDQYAKATGDDRTLNFYVTVSKDKENIIKFFRNYHSLASYLQPISQQNQTPIKFKTHSILDSFIGHNDSFKVYYYDPKLRDQIVAAVKKWLSDSSISTAARSHEHGVDVKSNGGSFGQLLSNHVYDEFTKLIKTNGAKVTPEQYFDWLKKNLPVLIAQVKPKEQMTESWSTGYKKSIDCSNPKGFSQRAHCAGRKARRAGKKTKSSSVSEDNNKPLIDAVLNAVPQAQEIWLHGSRARGTARPDSDTDILVVVPNSVVGEAYLHIVKKLHSLSSQFDNYDIQPARAENYTAQIAKEEGKLLWSSMNEDSVTDIHKLADEKGVKWDNDAKFMAKTKELTGKEHLDDLTPAELLKVQAWLKNVNENFADGKKPGRKGLSRRVGIPKKASLSKLQKIASSSTGERRRMAQWQLNMRRGKAKKNK